MKSPLLLGVLATFVSASLWADSVEQQKINNRLNDQRIQNEEPLLTQPVTQPTKRAAQSQQASDTNRISISKEELAKRPDLVQRALLPALFEGNSENVALLYPIYQQLPSQYHDETFMLWSQAILAKQKEDYTQAIKLYRQIIADKPNFSAVRLQLAIALFENSETVAADDQFRRLQSEPLPEAVQALVDQYLQAIAKRNSWSFGGGLTYLNDPNVNNAPKSGTRIGNWTAPEAESAHGVGFSVDVGKKWLWKNGLFNELRLDGSGKYYWDNKKYNEITGRASFGLGYQNARLTTAILPFIEQTWYAGGSKESDTLKRFSQASGVTLESSYWLSPKWQLNGSYEFAEQRYRTRLHLNGHSHFASGSLLYLANAKQYWFAGLDFNRTTTRDKDDSYDRKGVRVGWGQEWSMGLSSRISVSYAHKNYKGPMPIFNITQRNKEFGASVSLWHRAIHYKGITPRLTYSFTKVHSNHAFYSYDKHRLFIEVSKRF